MITDIEIVNFGICQITDESADADEESPTGHFLHSADIQFLGKTDKIKIKDGLIFGVEYLLNGIEEQNAELFECRILHPELINPNDNAAFTEIAETKVGCIGETNFDYYKFEYVWEAKPGKWIFEVSQGERLLLQKEFNLQA